MSLLDWLREFIRSCSITLSCTNEAVASGKAVDLLHQKLVGRYGIRDIRVISGGREFETPDITIRHHTYEPVTDQARRSIEHEIHLVNERYGTRIHPLYSSR